MSAVRLVSVLCGVAILATGIAAWASASESAWVTGQLVNAIDASASRPVLLTASQHDEKTD